MTDKEYNDKVATHVSLLELEQVMARVNDSLKEFDDKVKEIK